MNMPPKTVRRIEFRRNGRKCGWFMSYVLTKEGSDEKFFGSQFWGTEESPATETPWDKIKRWNRWPSEKHYVLISYQRTRGVIELDSEV